jgi:hypothetical protein
MLPNPRIAQGVGNATDHLGEPGVGFLETRQRLASRKLTLRQKNRIRAARERADASAPF